MQHPQTHSNSRCLFEILFTRLTERGIVGSVEFCQQLTSPHSPQQQTLSSAPCVLLLNQGMLGILPPYLFMTYCRSWETWEGVVLVGSLLAYEPSLVRISTFHQ